MKIKFKCSTPTVLSALRSYIDSCVKIAPFGTYDTLYVTHQHVNSFNGCLDIEKKFPCIVEITLMKF